MAKVLDNGRSGLVLVGEGRGRTLIPRGSPLTRLNYFDGKLLRAEDLRTEQTYVRRLVQMSNRAGGSGVVHGFDLSLASGDALGLGAGMAVDGAGRVLLLPTGAKVGIPALLEASRRGEARGVRIDEDGSARFVECEIADEPGGEEGVSGRELYLIVLTHAEALCGQEDVYGRLCERACETDTERPYRVEGVSLRALPLSLDRPLPDASAVALDRRHLRSRIASSFFRSEDRVPGDLLSREGLSSRTWCRGARERDGRHVALGVLAREGDTTVFLDAWTARRERMEAPPRRYWAGRMAMRPWNAYLAQILQFQCQLVDVLGGGPEPGAGDDPCREEKEALAETRRYLRRLEGSLSSAGAPVGVEDVSAATEDVVPGGAQELAQLNQRVVSALRSFAGRATGRVLVNGGIVELPPAGYLPVSPDSTVSVNRQVRDLVGDGVDLRFCVVRPDFPAHALEEAQHMERISLLDGLDDASDRPEVDVLVPDGEVSDAPATPGLYDVTVEVTPPAEAYGDEATFRAGTAPSLTRLAVGGEVELPTATVRGVARRRSAGSGGAALHWAGAPGALDPRIARLLGEALGEVFEEEDREGGEAAEAEAESEETVEESAEAAGEAAEETTAGGVEAEIRMNRVRIAEAATIREADTTPKDLEVGAWATLRYEGDPFALGEGDPLPCTLEAALGAAAEGRAGTVEVEAEGSLFVDEVTSDPDAGERTLRGRFRRVVLLLKPTLDGEPLRVESESVSLDAEIRVRNASDGAAGLVLELSHESGASVRVTGVRKEERVDGALRIAVVEERDQSSRIIESGTAAEGVVEGVVRTLEDRSPVPGANVVIEGTARGATTDVEGRFRISDAVGRDQTIVVSFVGMETARTTLDVVDGQPGPSLEVLLAPGGSTTEERVFQPARATAERTNRVLENDHPAHRSAVEALSLVGGGLSDPTFRARAEEALFGELEIGEGPPIRATRDWVLFHRRRVKECAPRPPREVRIRDRRYRVYHVGLGGGGGDGSADDGAADLLDKAERMLDAGDLAGALDLLNQVRAQRGAEPLTSQDAEKVAEAIQAERDLLEEGASGGAPETDPLVEALRSDDPGALADFSPEEVGTVTFAGDGVSLTTPASRVLEAWRGAEPGDAVVLGAIGSRGEALDDGPVLAEGRLERFEGTLEQATPLHPEATSVNLPGVPAGLDVTGADGVVVVATAVEADQEVETDCVDLFRRVVPRHQVDTILGMIEEGMVGEMASFATARFRHDTTELLSDMDALEQAWVDVGDATVREVWAYHVAAGSITVEQATEPARIMDLDPDTRILTPPVRTAGPCARADWVVLADDHRVAVTDAGAFGSLDEISSLVVEVGLGQADVQLTEVDGPVLFDVDTTDELHGLDGVTSAWNEMSADFPEGERFAVLSVSRSGASDARVQAHEAQATAIRDALGLANAPVGSVRSVDLAGFDGAAAVAVILRIITVE